MNSGRDEFADLPNNKLKNRTLCSQHFPRQAFTNDLRNKLLRNNPVAVPLPWFDLEGDNFENEDPEGGAGNHEESTHIDHPIATNEIEETVEDFNNQFKPLSEISKTDTLLDDITPRKKKLIRTVRKQTALLKKKTNSIYFIKRRTASFGVKSITDKLPNFLSGDPLIFFTMQLRHQTRADWTEDEKQIALSFYYKAPNVYKFMRDRGFKLPCITLIKKWINVNNVTPGFTTEVFDKVKIKAKSMTSTEKQCVLLFDEMSLRKSLEYNSKLDLIEGFEDLGPLGRNGKLATHATVFMLRGINNPWKCPLAYVLSNNALKSQSLALLLDLCIEKVIDANLDLKATVCDMGSTNSAALKLLGVTTDLPCYCFGSKQIYCLYDYPHLLKCVRNTLLKRDFLVAGNVVSWKDILEFYEIDKKSTSDCRAAPKISERHVNPQAFQKMNVKLATQVFSNSVSRGMKAAVSLGQLKSKSSTNTANLLGKLNDITDSLNSKHMDDKNPYKQPLSNTNLRPLHCLEAAIPYVLAWKTLDGLNPPCFEGLVQTLRGILMLYEDIYSSGNKFLLTGRFNQDPLENLFGVLRHRGGYNSNPSAKEFRRNLQHAISIRLLDPPDTANCQPDEDENLAVSMSEPNEDLQEDDIDDESKTSSISIPSTSHQQSEQPVIEDEIVTVFEESVICYISGWLGKKCIDKYSCDTCKIQLIKENCVVFIPREHLLFMKSFTTHTGDLAKLYKPSDVLHKVVKSQVTCFAKLLPKVIATTGVAKTLVEQITFYTENTHPQWLAECKEHKLFMLKLLVRCKLFYSVKWKSNDIRDSSLLKLRVKRVSQDDPKLNKKLKKLANM